MKPSAARVVRRHTAGGSRFLSNVNPAHFAHLSVSAAYVSRGDERWYNSLMRMTPKALENQSQWSDSTLERFAEKVEKAKGNRITKIQVYGETPDRKLIPLFTWSREDGLSAVRESAAALRKLDLALARAEVSVPDETPPREQVIAPSQGTWSVARTGYEVGGDAEDEYQGYVAEVEVFDSKADAIANAKDIGGAHVVKGTQMWNEPMGQVEEHGRTSWSRFYR